MLVMIAGPLFATTRKDTYDMTCNTLWPAVKGTVRNSGDYAVVFIDNDEMIASFAIGAGHAFKFASVIGRILGELVVDGTTPSDISSFSAHRQILTMADPPKTYMV